MALILPPSSLPDSPPPQAALPSLFAFRPLLPGFDISLQSCKQSGDYGSQSSAGRTAWQEAQAPGQGRKSDPEGLPASRTLHPIPGPVLITSSTGWGEAPPQLACCLGDLLENDSDFSSVVHGHLSCICLNFVFLNFESLPSSLSHTC